jgi:tetratricopeptide (TPR) repeat protein
LLQHVPEDVPEQLMEPSDSSTRALTLDEAVSFAIILQKNEQLAEAHELFRRIIEAAPDHPRALHYAGVLAHQQGRNDEALALIERSLALAPDQADWCSNRGIVLQSDGRLSLRSPPTGVRSHSIPATPTPTTIWVCCCGPPDSRSKRKPRIAKPSV